MPRSSRRSAGRDAVSRYLTPEARSRVPSQPDLAPAQRGPCPRPSFPVDLPGLVIAAASDVIVRAFLVMTLAPSVCGVPWTIPSRWACCSPRSTSSPPSPRSWWEAPRPLFPQENLAAHVGGERAALHPGPPRQRLAALRPAPRLRRHPRVAGTRLAVSFGVSSLTVYLIAPRESGGFHHPFPRHGRPGHPDHRLRLASARSDDHRLPSRGLAGRPAAFMAGVGALPTWTLTFQGFAGSLWAQ